MFTVSKSKPSNRVRRSKSSGSRVTSQPLPQQWQSSSPKKKKSFPVFIQILLLLQHTSSLVALGAIALSLVMYGLQFRTQQAWNQEYEELQSLQRYERTVTGINEALKDEIAESGSNNSQNLVPITPERNIYLQPAAIPNAEVSPSSSEPENQNAFLTNRPIAY
ncbi:MAG: hypothetical protein GVY04_15145 [Cyanobacteria bacterium]|jgi:hypothetical protein|nr:hypothetical protein [Cyanobacteria bacterium GSL.Bin1]